MGNALLKLLAASPEICNSTSRSLLCLTSKEFGTATSNTETGTLDVLVLTSDGLGSRKGSDGAENGEEDGRCEKTHDEGL